MSKPQAKSLRAADGMELMSRFAKHKGVLRASVGIAPDENDDFLAQMRAATEAPAVQVPTGPGMDRAGFLRRNPQLAPPMPATPNPALAHQGYHPQPPAAPMGNNPSAYSSGAPAAPFAGAGRGNINPALVDPSVTLTPPAAGPGIEMKGNPGVFKHGSNSFSDSAAAPAWSNTGKPSAENMALMDGFGQRDTARRSAAQGGFNPGAINSRPAGTAFAPGLKHGGDLRTGHGGDVPGTGSGDKIPAKYEPGEFVVSNDMLDAQPELRGHLRGLREEVLAAKGMTPEMADAKAMSGGRGLRAEGGWGQQEMFPRGAPSNKPLGAQMEIPMRAPEVAPRPAFDTSQYTPPKVNAEGYYENGRSIQGGSGAGQAGQAGTTVKVGAPATGVQAGGAGAGGSGRTGVLGAVREGLSHQPGPVSKAAFLTGKLLSSPLVGAAGRVGTGVGVIQNFNDYKLNDPGVDSSASGTWGALRDGDFAGAKRSLSKGAIEAGMDLGSFAANTADYLVPGKAPVSAAYNRMLRSNFGDRLVDNSGSSQGPKQAAPGVPSAATVAKPTLSIAGDATMPGQDPGRAAAQAAPVVDSAAATRKADRDALTLREGAMADKMQAERLAYESSGPSISPLRARLEQLGSQPGKLHINQAKMLAQLQSQDQQRDGVMAGHKVQADSNRLTNATALRGNEMTLEGHRLTNATSRNRLRYDMAKDERTYKDSRYDKHLEQDAAAAKRAGESFSGMFDTTDPKTGQVIKRTDLEAQAVMTARRASGGKFDMLSPAEQAKHVASAHSYVSILDSARKHQNNGWMQAIGIDNPDAPRGGLPTPEELSQGKLERVGFREGAATLNTGKGGWVVRLPNGKDMYLDANISGEHLKYLQDQGVK